MLLERLIIIIDFKSSILVKIESIANTEFIFEGEMCLYVSQTGVFAFLAQICFNQGVMMESAGLSSLVRNLDVVFAFFWQVVVLHDSPNAWSFFGAFLILASVIASGYKRWRASQAKETPVLKIDEDNIEKMEIVEPDQLHVGESGDQQRTSAQMPSARSTDAGRKIR